MSKRFTVQEAVAPYTKAIIANANVEYPPCRAIMVNKAYVAEDSAFTDTDGTDGNTSGTTATTESANNIENPQLMFAADDTLTTLATTLMADSTIYPFSVKMHNSGTNTLIFLY